MINGVLTSPVGPFVVTNRDSNDMLITMMHYLHRAVLTRATLTA
jgi:hypothetical protein